MSSDLKTLDEIKNIGKKMENSISEYFYKSNLNDPTVNFDWEYILIENKNVRLIGVEAGGLGLSSGKHAAPLNDGKEGVLHGMRTYLMQDDSGQITETHSVSAGLDYPGVGPEHAWLKDIGRAEYVTADDEEALEAFKELTRIEGIMPALETAHGIAHVKKIAPSMSKEQSIVVNVSGRGDKDINTVADIEGIEL